MTFVICEVYICEATLEINLAVYGKIETIRTIRPAILLVGLFPRKPFTSVCKAICRKMYTAALVVIGKKLDTSTRDVDN